MILNSKSADETHDIGYTIGREIIAGSVVCIEGEMGAGKTAISQGIIRGLGVVEKYITSPTYTIINEYNLDDKKVYHCDVYRISDYEELLLIGFEEYFVQDSVVIVEWADLFREYLPENCIWVSMEKGTNDNRKIRIDGLKDQRYGKLKSELRKWS